MAARLHALAASSAASPQFKHPFALPQKPFRPQILRCPWLSTVDNLSICARIHLGHLDRKRPPIEAVVSFSPPAVDPEKKDVEKAPKWSSQAIRSIAMGELEARKHRRQTIGSDNLVMGILVEGTSFSSQYLRAKGITLSKVRDEALEVHEKPDKRYMSPLILQYSEEAEKALDWAINEKLKSGEDGAVTTVHLLLGVWSQQDAPGRKVLARLGFSEEKAKELVTVLSETGFFEE